MSRARLALPGTRVLPDPHQPTRQTARVNGPAIRRYATLATVLALAIAAVLLVGFTRPELQHPTVPRLAVSGAESPAPASAAPTSAPRTTGWPAGTVAVKPAFGGTVTVISPGRPPRPVQVGSQLSALALGPAGTLYATDSTSGELFRIDPPGNAEKVAEVGGTPGAMAVSPTTGDVVVLDQAMPFATILAPDGSRRGTVAVGPGACAIAFAGDQTVVFGQGAGTADSPPTLTRITGTTAQRPVPLSLTATGLAVAADGTGYLANSGEGTLTVRPPTGDSRTIKGFQAPTAVLLGPDGTLTVVDGPTLRILNADGTSRATVDLPGEPNTPTVAPAGTPNAGVVYAGVNAIEGVVAVDPSTGHVSEISTGKLPIRIAVTPGSGDIVVVDRVDPELSRIDPVTLAVTREQLAQPSDNLVVVGTSGS